jgi:excisionase family DNA binding protein
MDYLKLMEKLDRMEHLMVAHKEVLTFEEASEYTGISRSYLYKLTASRQSPHSKPNGKMIFFEKEKLNEWLLQNRRKSNNEIAMEASVYCLKNQKR